MLDSAGPLAPNSSAAALDRLIRFSGCDGGRGTLLAALLLVGCVNGWVARAVEAWHADGTEAVTQIFGISPFELVVAGIGAALVASGRGVRLPALGAVAIGFALAVIVPSGLASWAAVFVYGLWVGFSCRDAARCGGLLIAGLAACAIWWAAGEKLLGELPLAADAAAAAHLAALFVTGVRHAGNVISNPSGHAIVVLTACSTTHGLPIALVSMLALATRPGETARHEAVASGMNARKTIVTAMTGPETVDCGRLAAAAIGLTAAYSIANLIRLVILAWSPAVYAVGHGSWGLAAFDVVATGLTLAFAAVARGGR